MAAKKRSRLRAAIDPGLPGAATGAGDLATDASTGNPLGGALPCAAVLGAFLMPLLALALRIVDGCSDWFGRGRRSRSLIAIGPMATILSACGFPLPHQDDLWYPPRG